MQHEKLYRDSVHGLIVLHPGTPEDRTIMRLIDAREVQRLRRIRQLGLANLVFQGAEHSRFSHAIGVMHVATRILDQLGRQRSIPPLARFATRCAALLHDLGHGPLSHVFEGVLGIDHEHWTRRIILSPSCEVHGILKSHHPRLPSLVASILNGKARPDFLTKVISSQLDADRFDYLLRDSLMTGVKYGVYDLDRLLYMLRVGRDGTNIVVASGGVLPVEKYLQARYHMYSQVYFHKAVRSAELMLKLLLGRASQLARRAELTTPVPDGALHRLLAAEQVSLADYLGTDDSTVFSAMHLWACGPDPILADLSQRLLERRLFKTMDVTNVRGLPAKVQAARRILSRAGLDPDYYLALVTSTSSPYRPYNPKTPGIQSHILVESERTRSRTTDIHQVSPVVQGLARASGRSRLVVFPESANGTDLRERMESIFRAS